MVEIKRQETQHAREIVKAIKDRDFEKAYSSLEQRGAFREIENREDRNRQVVDEYLSDRKAGVYSVILTSTNATAGTLINRPGSVSRAGERWTRGRSIGLFRRRI